MLVGKNDGESVRKDSGSACVKEKTDTIRLLFGNRLSERQLQADMIQPLEVA
jgi:hypothetical protein